MEDKFLKKSQEILLQTWSFPINSNSYYKGRKFLNSWGEFVYTGNILGNVESLLLLL